MLTVSESLKGDATNLLQDSIVWDMTMPWGTWGRDDLKIAALNRLEKAHYTVTSLTLGGDDADTVIAMRSIAEERARIRNSDGRFILIESVDDVERCHREKKLGISFHFQGTVPAGRDLNLIEVYYKLGIRHMLMAYNQKNFVGDGCHERTDCGLSRYGVSFVQEMNRVGMVVDVSHTGLRTTMDVFGVAKGPVIFSHSNPKAIYDHPRNITDEQIRACVSSGGVIGVNGVGIFLGEDGATSEAIFKCIDYLASLVGADYIGLGLDSIYDLDGIKGLTKIRGKAAYPLEGGYDADLSFATPEQVLDVTALMLKHGYSHDQIKGILGQNWLRVCRAVWR